MLPIKHIWGLWLIPLCLNHSFESTRKHALYKYCLFCSRTLHCTYWNIRAHLHVKHWHSWTIRVILIKQISVSVHSTSVLTTPNNKNVGVTTLFDGIIRCEKSVCCSEFVHDSNCIASTSWRYNGGLSVHCQAKNK